MDGTSAFSPPEAPEDVQHALEDQGYLADIGLATLRAEVEAMLDRIQESLKIRPTLAPLFTVRWEVQ